ncbi:MAG TPA: hypothetical protein VHO91_07055 [Rhodopila sp.]|nr:hypothetical protein [Rhodopila sp.]
MSLRRRPVAEGSFLVRATSISEQMPVQLGCLPQKQIGKPLTRRCQALRPAPFNAGMRRAWLPDQAVGLAEQALRDFDVVLVARRVKGSYDFV